MSNCRIITNVHSFNCYNDTIYCDDILEIIKIAKEMFEKGEPFMIFFDEIFTILEKGGSLSVEVLSFISQLRKRKVYFVTTAQEWSEINITFRRYCRYQVCCNMISLPFSKTAILINKINDAYQMKWDGDLQEFIAPTIRTNISKGMKSVIDSYDTFETITVGKSITRYRR